MIKKKICLFTAHSPLLGGGGVILRSLLAYLTDLDISWYYIADKPAPGYHDGYLGKGLMGGPILTDISQTWRMLRGGNVELINNVIDQLLQVNCDSYWIVSHNEGLRIALELAERQTGRPVHMTVHDDWAGALCARSVRYGLMGSAAKKLTIAALKAVSSFDVISLGMQNYYQQLSGRRGEICHRYLPAKALLNSTKYDNADTIVAGHIGSIYDKADFIAFVNMFVNYVKSIGKKPVVMMWGCHLKITDLPAYLQDHVIFGDTLPEKGVIPQLAKCDFVYGMYPMSKSLHIFARTSLPTKLTSYLQAGRPILGHCPADSTLAEFITTTSLGAIWASNNRDDGNKALQQVLNIKTQTEQWQTAREKYFGEQNLVVMDKVLNR